MSDLEKAKKKVRKSSGDIDIKVTLTLLMLAVHCKTTSKKNLTITSYQQIVTSLSFFQVMANLEQSGSRILDA